MSAVYAILLARTSDTVNGSHNVSLPMILIKIKVGQLLQSSCISSLLVPIFMILHSGPCFNK